MHMIYTVCGSSWLVIGYFRSVVPEAGRYQEQGQIITSHNICGM